MAWDGYFSLAGTELANEERFRTYVSTFAPGLPIVQRQVENFSETFRAVGDLPYVSPLEDRAPWVDVNDPVTQDFLGMQIVDVTNIDDSTRSASVTESLGRGGTVGPSREGSREIRFSALLAGLTEESVRSGMTWLERALWRSGNPVPLVPEGIGASDLRFFAQRPEIVERVINAVLNPDALGLNESLMGTAGSAYAFRVPVTATDWAYRVITRTLEVAEAALIAAERPAAMSNQMWVARARLRRDASVLGSRQLALLLRFRDQYGNIILGANPSSTSVPEGVLYRWTGARDDSISQMLTPQGMVQNFIVNPAARGVVPGLFPDAGSSSVSIDSGVDAYLLTTPGPYASSARSATPAPAASGQQWWGSAEARIFSAAGPRSFTAGISFADGSGREISRATGTKVTLAPTGTYHRWQGARNASISEEVVGSYRRFNYNPNPTMRDNLDGYTSEGPATLVRERFPAMGTPMVLRVNPTATGGPIPTGVVLPFKNLPIGEYDLEFLLWTDGPQSLRLAGTGWNVQGSTGDDINGRFFVFSSGGASVLTVVKIHVTVSQPTQKFLIMRDNNGNGYTFRLARIGMLTGGASYFDGDTGTFEFEGTYRRSSSIAHLAGDVDRMNMLLNAGFQNGIEFWTQKAGTSISWDGTGKSLVATTTGALSAGSAFMEEAGHGDLGGGSRVLVGGRIYNLSSAAITVAAQTYWDGPNAAVLTGPSVTIPANGNAWVGMDTPANIPAGVSYVYPRFVTINALPSGAAIGLRNPIMSAGLPAQPALTQAQWFDGDTAGTDGAEFDGSLFAISVGAVAPEGTQSASLIITRTADGLPTAGDRILVNQLFLTQQDPQGSRDPQVPVTPTLPAYFDGSFPSTFNVVPRSVVNSTPGAGSDTVWYDLEVHAAAPAGAVSAELAVQRTDSYSPVAGDVIYATNLMLSAYEGTAPPAYTSVTRRNVIAETERWIQNVRAINGPSVIRQNSFGADGCRGTIAQVEFTLVAEDPSALQNSDRVPLPLPAAFGRVEDLTGVVKNYMPQYTPGSSIVPSEWDTTQDVGVTTATAFRLNDVTPQVLRLDAQDGNTRFGQYFRAINALGEDGGFENAIASIWIGSATAGAKFTISVSAHEGNSPQVGGASTVWTAPDSSGGDIFNDAHRVDLVLPASAKNGAANGFIMYVHPETSFTTLFVGVPQVTLGSQKFPMIWGGNPDDGTYTYSFDGLGYSQREPVQRPESHTLFPNLTAPPVATASIGGYNETGLSSVRGYADIETDSVPANAVAVPVMRIDFERLMTRQCRIRFYPNPTGADASKIPPASWEYEWIVQPLHANAQGYSAPGGYMSIAIDGVSEVVSMRAFDGTVIPGDQYVTTSDGAPISWPELSGIPWVVTIDYPTFHLSAAEPADETWWRASLALVVKE